MNISRSFLKNHLQKVMYLPEINISMNNIKNWRKRNVIYRNQVS